MITEVIDTTTDLEGSTTGDTIAADPTPEPETTTDPSLESTTIDDTARKLITPEPESSTFAGN